MHLDAESSRPRRLIAAVALTLLALGGCGDDPAPKAPALSWVGTPQVVRQPELPRDRIVIGKVRNGSEHRLRLDADRARVLDTAGKPLRSTVRFSSAFGHGLYSPRRPPSESVPEFERVRLGALAIIAPGRTAPLTVSWRIPAGGADAAKLVVGGLEIELPRR